MPAPRAPAPPTLPVDADGVLKLAAQSLFETLASTAMGMLVVDRGHRIVWISEGYKQFLPALGRAEADFVGRQVEEVVPNTLMAHVIDSGQPILVDLLTQPRRHLPGQPAAAARRRAARSSARSAWCCSTTPRRRCSR